jgi:hypothetical protein
MEKLKTRKKMITLNEDAKPKDQVHTQRGALIYSNPARHITTSVWYFDFPEIVLNEGDEFTFEITGKMVNGTLCQA